MANESKYLFNLVNAEAAADLKNYLAGQGGLAVAAQKFYERFEDSYDFIYFLGYYQGDARFYDVGIDTPEGVGKLPKGLTPATAQQTDNSANYRASSRPEKLKGVIGLPLSMQDQQGNICDISFGVMIHETAHRWGNFLQNPELAPYRSHWGYSSVNGSLGGFDANTLVIQEGEPRSDGTPGATTVQVAPFSLDTSNDRKGYSPLELYLMGLLDESEVPTIMVLDNPRQQQSSGGALVFEVDGIKEVTIGQIIDVNGKCPPGPKSYRGAFVLVSESEVPADKFKKIEKWAKIFGGIEQDRVKTLDEHIDDFREENGLERGGGRDGLNDFAISLAQKRFDKAKFKILSFAEATGNRATMDVEL